MTAQPPPPSDLPSATGAPVAGVRGTPLLQSYPPVLHNRNFLLLWIAYIVSSLGDRIQMLVALHLLCGETMLNTRNPATGQIIYGTQPSSQLTIAMLLPFAVLGPFSGLLADRLPRRAVMITADAVRALVIIAVRTVFIEFSGGMSLHTLMVLLFGSELLMATFSAFFSPARSALLPNLVHPTQLLRANSLVSGAGTIASLLGFIAGGALIKWHFVYAMYAGALTFLCSATCISLMRLRRAGEPKEPERQRRGAVRDFTDGFRYIVQHRHVMQVIALMLVFWSVGTIILNGLSGILTIHFGLNEDWYANFMGLVGLGMILGAAAVSLTRRGIPKEVGIAWSMVGVGVFVFLFALVPAGVAAGGLPWWIVGLILLMAASFLGAVLLVSLETLLARITPDHVRGRVMGVKDVLTTVGLLVPVAPLAMYKGIDAYMRPVLGLMAGAVFVVGVGLVVTYYRSQTLPLPAAIVRRVAAAVMTVWHRYRREGACTIPGTGPVIVVANHSNTLDPVVLQISSPRRVVHFMMAREYYEAKPFHYIYRLFGAIPVNRSGTDIASVRTALRALQEGKVIGIFPEGRMSMTGEMQDARPGVAALVLMSGATVVPAFISGVRPHAGMIRDCLHRQDVRIRYGRRLRFDEYKGRDRDKATLEEVTGKIMAAIAGVRDAGRGKA